MGNVSAAQAAFGKGTDSPRDPEREAVSSQQKPFQIRRKGSGEYSWSTIEGQSAYKSVFFCRCNVDRDLGNVSVGFKYVTRAYFDSSGSKERQNCQLSQG